MEPLQNHQQNCFSDGRSTPNYLCIPRTSQKLTSVTLITLQSNIYWRDIDWRCTFADLPWQESWQLHMRLNPYCVIKGSMVTASHSGRCITRNFSFFKRLPSHVMVEHQLKIQMCLRTLCHEASNTLKLTKDTLNFCTTPDTTWDQIVEHDLWSTNVSSFCLYVYMSTFNKGGM